MSLLDNEIYRGVSESGVTLTREKTPGATDFYIVNPPQTTVQQDMAATTEEILQESKPVRKKKSRIADAMKLLASGVATVAVVVSAVAPAKPAQEQLALWSKYSPADESHLRYVYDPVSVNSTDCQVANYHDTYLVSAQQEGIYLRWDGGFYTYFDVTMSIPAVDLEIFLNFDADPESSEQRYEEYQTMYSPPPAFATGQVQTTSGETLYVIGYSFLTQEEETEGELRVRQMVDHLDEYIQISEGTEDGWDKLLIGDTMYSEITPAWCGSVGAPNDGESLWYELCAIYPLDKVDCSADKRICQRQVNGIDWSFYYGDLGLAPGFNEHVIWAVPAQEEIALGYDSIVGGTYLQLLEGFFADDVASWASENYGDGCEWVIDFCTSRDPSWEIERYGADSSVSWMELLEVIVDNVIVKYIVGEIHPVEQPTEKNPGDISTETTGSEGSNQSATDAAAPEESTEAATEATEALPRIETIILYEYTDPDEKGVETIYYDQDDVVFKTEQHLYSNGALVGYILWSNQDGFEVEETYHYEEDGDLTYKKVNDGRNEVYYDEEYFYDENGVLYAYVLTHYDSGYIGAAETEIYCEEYDADGAVINSSHHIYDSERELWTVKNYKSKYSTSYGASGESWPVTTFADGIFTTCFPYYNGQLVEGVYYEIFEETGKVWNYTQMNADGSGKWEWYYADGSVEQLSEKIIDAETNTWIHISEYHPAPSDDFAYHNETRVTFSSDGRIAAFYDKTDDRVIEAEIGNDDETVKHEVYDEFGRLIECHLSDDKEYASVIWFEYDQWGRLQNIGSGTTWYG